MVPVLRSTQGKIYFRRNIVDQLAFAQPLIIGQKQTPADSQGFKLRKQ